MPHPSGLSRIKQLAFPEASFKRINNGLLIWIHCMVRELRVPVCLPARRPQRKTNVNYARGVSDTLGPHDESTGQPLHTALSH